MDYEERRELDKERSYKIVKSNTLIQNTRIPLTLQEQKIILFIISRIKPEDKELLEQEFQITEFCKICGIDSNNGGNYAYIKNAFQRLGDKSSWIAEGKKEILFRWLTHTEINKQSGLIKVMLHPFLKPYLLELKEKFTAYELIHTLPMKSQYSLRIFELLKSYEWKNNISFDIDELKKLLLCEKYVNFKDFRVKVLEKAIKEINQYTDINVSYTLTKKGNKIISIKFIIKRKELFEIFLIGSLIDKKLSK